MSKTALLVTFDGRRKGAMRQAWRDEAREQTRPERRDDSWSTPKRTPNFVLRGGSVYRDVVKQSPEVRSKAVSVVNELLQQRLNKSGSAGSFTSPRSCSDFSVADFQSPLPQSPVSCYLSAQDQASMTETVLSEGMKPQKSKHSSIPPSLHASLSVPMSTSSHSKDVFESTRSFEPVTKPSKKAKVVEEQRVMMVTEGGGDIEQKKIVGQIRESPKGHCSIRDRLPRGQTRKLATMFEALADAAASSWSRVKQSARGKSMPATTRNVKLDYGRPLNFTFQDKGSDVRRIDAGGGDRALALHYVDEPLGRPRSGVEYVDMVEVTDVRGPLQGDAHLPTALKLTCGSGDHFSGASKPSKPTESVQLSLTTNPREAATDHTHHFGAWNNFHADLHTREFNRGSTIYEERSEGDAGRCVFGLSSNFSDQKTFSSRDENSFQDGSDQHRLSLDTAEKAEECNENENANSSAADESTILNKPLDITQEESSRAASPVALHEEIRDDKIKQNTEVALPHDSPVHTIADYRELEKQRTLKGATDESAYMFASFSASSHTDPRIPIVSEAGRVSECRRACVPQSPLSTSTPVGSLTRVRSRHCASPSPNRSFISSITARSYGQFCDDEHDFATEIKKLQGMSGVFGGQLAQAQIALRQCKKSSPFRGTLSELTAHRAYVLARERQQMVEKEMQRLRVLHMAKKLAPFSAKGTETSLDVTSITILLNRNFCVRNIDERDTYAFLVILKAGKEVDATQPVTLAEPHFVRASAVRFNDNIRLEHLPNDFAILVEVYALKLRETQRCSEGPCSQLKSKAKLLISPAKKRLEDESVISSSEFTLCGYITINRETVGLKKIFLNNPEYPLEGTIEIETRFLQRPCLSSTFKAEVKYRGFLTANEVVDSMSAWSRYWAVLRANVILLWKYPDDEASDKMPLTQIDLSRCVQERVAISSPQSCPHPHSFCLELLVTPSAAASSFTQNRKRLHMWGDTKELSLVWVEHLNEALSRLRS